MIVIFLGPTLGVDEARRILPAHYLPPASQGDVYRAARRRPDAIGIIDGRFEQVPPVWHKEILWALSQGIPVFGSASMGALRAAELHSFGMRGIGTVFQQYRDGLLEDDDEVAVQHGPRELGYIVLSDAMVNIRATLRRAHEEGIIGASVLDALVSMAKAMHFPQRHYNALLGAAAADGVPEPALAALRTWLQEGKVDVKREDAIAMLRAMAGYEPARICSAPAFGFETTALWAELVRSADTIPPGDEANEAGTGFMHEIVMAGRRKGLLTEEMRTGVMARILALDESRRHNVEIDADALGAGLLNLRRRLQLADQQALERWMEENRLDVEQLVLLAEEEARLEWVRSLLREECDAALPRYLQARAQFGEFVRRATARGAAGDPGDDPTR